MDAAGDLAGVVESGAAVDVRDQFEGLWHGGFEVFEAVMGRGGDGDWRYRLRRVSDGEQLSVGLRVDNISRARDVWALDRPKRGPFAVCTRSVRA